MESPEEVQKESRLQNPATALQPKIRITSTSSLTIPLRTGKMNIRDMDCGIWRKGDQVVTSSVKWHPRHPTRILAAAPSVAQVKYAPIERV